MTLANHSVTVTLTIKEAGVWLEALRLAATKSTVPIFPWYSCPFLIQHESLSKLLGYGTEDHLALRRILEERASK